MRVLIIGTVRAAHRALVELGHDVVLFINKKAVLPADLDFPYKQVHMFEEFATEQDYADLATVLHANQPFDAISCLNDNCQKQAITVSQALGLSFPISLDSLELTISKDRTRNQLTASGTDDTRFALVSNIDAVHDFCEQASTAHILKPVNGTGSKGIVKLESGDNALSKILSLGLKVEDVFPAIIEEYLEGPEFSVEALSENGEHRIIAITHKLKDPTTFIELGHAIPADLSGVEEQLIVGYVKEVLDSVGVTDGPSHSEVIFTANGPRLIETHTRPGGDNIWDLMKIATGVDLMNLSVRQMLGERILNEIPHDLPKQSFAAIRYAAPSFGHGAKLTRVEGVAEARSKTGVVDVNILKNIGAEIGPLLHSFDRAASVISKGESLSDALANAATGLEQLEFHTCWSPKEVEAS
ncbi:ATP-grasp domain-containing protein [Pseudoalteromonas sp. DL2-H2.2]|uniref:ATP-grasp domain-containing protein n=1 Tax=Pseudoalteromonas sp. DL2-H2.2 TaxID=2908889 RepID=UPI001F16C492|nr:ATP-grasp domain-containing protein [Pseudoalteromonas sp. DL2-H2.2]MCF2907558.1 ATP-grasp domain-containing protein [Pseudoalteromonas sp. DL2-H2.2]